MSSSNVEHLNKVECKYGDKCYQRNKKHLEKFEHPKRKEEMKGAPAAKRARTDSCSMKQQKLNLFFKKKSPKKTNPTEANSDDIVVEEGNTNLEISETSPEKAPESSSSQDTSTDDASESTSVPPDEEKCQETIEKLFFVRMPPDFFSLWQFCTSLSPKKPHEALKAIDLTLVGPYDVLNGNMKDDIDSALACTHWRYFYDPPEFQTVLKGNKSELMHFGYYRDDPKDLPVFVGCNKAAKDAVIIPVGENLFAAINWCIKRCESSKTPFQKVQLSSLKNELHKWAKERKISLSDFTDNMRNRDKKVVARTLHRAGIVVPYDKKTELGYRPLSQTQTELCKILEKIVKSKNDAEKMAHMCSLHEVVTWANIAMDEGDYGTTLELGIDLFSYGSEHFKSMILQLLSSSYKLLKRDTFFDIIKAHLENRKKGDDLSVLCKEK